MNKRIRELAEQAQPDPIAYRVEHFQGDVGYWDKDEPVWKSELYQKDSDHFTCKPLYTQEDLEKFAELIVRECIQTLIDKTPERYTNEASEEDWDKGYDRAMKDCVHHIQEHFGVSE